MAPCSGWQWPLGPGTEGGKGRDIQGGDEEAGWDREGKQDHKPHCACEATLGGCRVRSKYGEREPQGLGDLVGKFHRSQQKTLRPSVCLSAPSASAPLHLPSPSHTWNAPHSLRDRQESSGAHLPRSGSLEPTGAAGGLPSGWRQQGPCPLGLLTHPETLLDSSPFLIYPPPESRPPAALAPTHALNPTVCLHSRGTNQRPTPLTPGLKDLGAPHKRLSRPWGQAQPTSPTWPGPYVHYLQPLPPALSC